jgi:hypothetical protein
MRFQIIFLKIMDPEESLGLKPISIPGLIMVNPFIIFVFCIQKPIVQPQKQ